jgi:predicted porin
MKTTWRAIALAAALASGASAFAQSSVTLYGRIDLNLTRTSNKTQSSLTGPSTSNNQWDMLQTSTSRIGVRGSEDLGGGMAAIFQLESAINADTGAADSRFWGRESWVGLRGGFGTFRMGRTLTPSQRVASNYDPHGTDGIGSFGSSGLLIGLSALPRFQDGLYYETPNLSGFTVFAGVQMDDIADANDDRHKSVRFRYASGPLDASLSIANMGNDDKVNTFGLSYKLGAFTPMFQYHSGERAGVDRSVLLIGTLAKLGPGELRAAWSKSDDKRDARAAVGTTPAVTPDDRTLFAVGYDYPLSKRTLMYGTFANDSTKRETVAGSFTRTRSRGFEAGIRHSF